MIRIGYQLKENESKSKGGEISIVVKRGRIVVNSNFFRIETITSLKVLQLKECYKNNVNITKKVVKYI